MGAKKDSANRLNGLHVLVVEDTVIVAQTVVAMLAGLGCRVCGPFAKLSEAIVAAQTEDLDGALLDVSVQEGFVYPAADVLIHRNIPFVFLSGYDAQSLDSTYRKHPQLTKPFDVKELSDSLHEAVEAQRSAAQPRNRQLHGSVSSSASSRPTARK